LRANAAKLHHAWAAFIRAHDRREYKPKLFSSFMDGRLGSAAQWPQCPHRFHRDPLLLRYKA